MNLNSRILPVAAFTLLAGVLAGCAQHSHSHDAGSHATMDMQSMCERHKKEMSGKSPAQRQAMMDEHMKSMPPETRARMQAMHERCQ